MSLVSVARNLVLAASVSVRSLGEDPLHFAVQTARRFPGGVARPVARTLRWRRDGGGLRPALAAWLTDEPAEASELLRSAAPRSRIGRRVVAELGVQLGVTPDLDAPASVRARARWAAGDIEEAVALAEGALAGRYASEAAVLRGQRRPVAAATGAARRAVSKRPAALHVLTNSVPHTLNGYTARSHAILRAQREAGIRVGAATRIGYPVSIGRLGAAPWDVVDGIPYQRLLPAALPRDAADRLQRQVDLLLPEVRRFGPTVLHTTTDYTNALVTRAAAEATGLPWVYEVRGLLEDTWSARRASMGDPLAGRSERYGLLRERETEMMLAADQVVTLSRTLADELVERGVDRRKVTLVPNAVDPALLADRTSAPAAREALGLPHEGFWVGTVSSLVDYEGLDTLLDAVALLRERGVDARCCIVGDGVSRPGLVRRAAHLGLGAHAVFPGRVDRARAVMHHRALDVFAVPRRDVRVCRMVTPLKPVEAMACGRPVVASDLPALAELVDEPGTGVLAPAGDAEAWADALLPLASDPSARETFGEAGRDFAAGRTWAAGAQTYRELYAHTGGAR